MPKVPQGQKRPADVIGNAVHVMRIATGQVEEKPKSGPAAELGSKGGKARAAKLSKAERGAIARKAAAKRWGQTVTAPDIPVPLTPTQVRYRPADCAPVSRRVLVGN